MIKDKTTKMVKPTLICAGLLASLSTTEAALLFFDNEAEYQTALDNHSKDITIFDRPFTPEYIATSPLYAGTQPIANDQGRGFSITFQAESVPMNGISPTIWSLQALDTDADLVWQDNEFDNPDTHGPIISIGDVNNHEDDDFAVSFKGSTDPGENHNVGFSGYLYGNAEESGEIFNINYLTNNLNISGNNVFTAADHNFGSSDNNGFNFFGAIVTGQDERLSRIAFNEGSGGDDIGVAGFSFAVAQNASVPEPSSTALLGLGALGLLARRRRKTA